MSITITIKIDGGEVLATIIAPQSATTDASYGSIPSSISSVGSMDAGAAPNEMHLSRISNFPDLPSNQNTSIDRISFMSAGAAPTTRVPSGMVSFPSGPLEDTEAIDESDDLIAGSAPISQTNEEEVS